MSLHISNIDGNQKISKPNRRFKVGAALVCCLGLFISYAQAEDKIPESVEKALQQKLAGNWAIVDYGNRERMSAVGDVNRDGLKDWAGFVVRGQGEQERLQLMVFTGNGKGGFTLAATSKEEASWSNCCWVDGIEIKKQSLFVFYYGKTASMRDDFRYQFKYQRGGYFLIGAKRSRHEKICEEDKLKLDEIDLNLITGRKVVVTTDDDCKHAKYTRSKIPVKPLIGLKLTGFHQLLDVLWASAPD
jgi:hypothetical protein